MARRDQYGNKWSVHYDDSVMADGRWVVYKNDERYTSFHTKEEAKEYVDEQCD